MLTLRDLGFAIGDGAIQHLATGDRLIVANTLDGAAAIGCFTADISSAP